MFLRRCQKTCVKHQAENEYSKIPGFKFKSKHNCNLPFQTKVSWVHFAKILCHMFRTALPLLQKWQENQQRLQRSSQRHRHRDDQKLGVHEFMVESLCVLSRELASRHLLQNTFLEQHSKVLQIPEDKGRSFPLFVRLGFEVGSEPWRFKVTDHRPLSQTSLFLNRTYAG